MSWPTALDAPRCDPSLFFHPSNAPERINEKRSESSRAQKTSNIATSHKKVLGVSSYVKRIDRDVCTEFSDNCMHIGEIHLCEY